MNTIIDHSTIIEPLNKCFKEYSDWPITPPKADVIMNGFKYHMESNAGLRLNFVPEIRSNQFGYKLEGVELVDEQLYTVWLLRWS